jgi:putative DNA methylase
MTQQYPKRLIEVDLPIKRISAHSRREKSIRHGHISTMHIWWARRPLAACRAVLCASLWPDPADPLCPAAFRETAKLRMTEWVREHIDLVSEENWSGAVAVQKDPSILNNSEALRKTLLDFIADFSNWDNSTNEHYLATARILTQSAHEGLGGITGTRALVVDPFSGGGAIPFEALRVGADTFATDLNPVASVLEKTLLYYAPQASHSFSGKLRDIGKWIKQEARKQLTEFYPADRDGRYPIVFLWARTIVCEGPGCGAELPLIGQVWLSKKDRNSAAFGMTIDRTSNTVTIRVIHKPRHTEVMSPISKKSSATCPVCGYTTPAKHVRTQLSQRNGGSNGARLLAIVTADGNGRGKSYRDPTEDDLACITKAVDRCSLLNIESINNHSLIPDEQCPPEGALGFRFQKYGITKWRDLYTSRQLVALATFAKIIASEALESALEDSNLSESEKKLMELCLALALGRVNDLSATLCRWLPSLEAVAATNGGQNKMPIILDFAEANPIGGAGGDFEGQIDWIARVMDHIVSSKLAPGTVERCPAALSPLPDDSADALITDPPYYDAFGYSDLSEFFFIWLRRALNAENLGYSESEVPKEEEVVSIGKTLLDGRGEKTDESYQLGMAQALRKQREIVKPNGIAAIVFANKSTKGWEAILQAIIDGGWMVTASWPIDTERPNRQRAIGSAALQSSIHLICRPRENPDGSLREDEVGDWRDLLQELPKRIHDWMPRLANEGVVGADAIFACLGPALEIFSRYSSVEKADGTPVPLRDYLEQVWAAVSKEALNMVFQGADATGFEEDARLTAMWLWTLAAGASDVDRDDDKVERSTGYSMEYDAARKIAQGLGVHMEDLPYLVEVSGDQARLLAVAERTKHLFGKDEAQAPSGRGRKKAQQADLFDELKEVEAEGGWGVTGAPKAGETVLDRIHQSMILFAANRGEALKRFLVEEGIGRDPQFWRLAQALSALYPSQTDEKRWVDGVLARKKGLGF